MKTQLHKEAMMNDKKCNRGYASEELMHKMKEMRALNEE